MQDFVKPHDKEVLQSSLIEHLEEVVKLCQLLTVSFYGPGGRTPDSTVTRVLTPCGIACLNLKSLLER